MARALALAVACTLLPATALAQLKVAQFKFEGLERPKKKVEKPAEKPPEEKDYTKGGVVLVVPPRRTGGKAVDAETYKLLHAALKERLGARLVTEEVTLKAIEQEKLTATLGTPEGIAKLAAVFKAGLVIAFEAAPTKIEARVYTKPGEPPTGEPQIWLWGVRRVNLPLAKLMVGDLLKSSGAALLPPEEKVPALVVESPAVPEQEMADDVSAEAAPVVKTTTREPFAPPPVIALVGVGASFRSFSAVSQLPVIPESPGAMAGFGFNLAVYPLRFIPSLAKGKLADLSLEGSYRLNAAQAVVVPADTDPFTCKVDDDEIVARVSYRYPLPGRLPRVGVGVGWTSERTLFACAAPALSTRYQATELHLKVLQPIIGEQLAVELSGGPRFLFSQRAAGFASSAFSLEAWVTGRPVDYFYARAGMRLTSTRLTTWPDGVSVADTRTFVGVELGASL